MTSNTPFLGNSHNQRTHILSANDSIVGPMEVFKLRNGLKVCILPRQGSQIISAVIAINCGSQSDPSDKAGLAHFLEHVLFCGSNRFPKKNDFDRNVRQREGRSNGATSYHYTTFEVELPSGTEEFALRCLKHLVFEPLFDESAIARERDIVLAERAQKADDPFNTLLGKVFPDTYVGRPILGSDASIRSITAADLSEQHRRFYQPGNATLFLSGSLDRSVVDLICEIYGGDPGPHSSTAKPAEVAKVSPRVVTASEFNFWGSESTAIEMAFHAPISSAEDRFASHAIKLILAGQSDISLNGRLREAMGLTYDSRCMLTHRAGLSWYHLAAKTPKSKSFVGTKELISVARQLGKVLVDKALLAESIQTGRAARRFFCSTQIDSINFLHDMWREVPETETPDSFYQKIMAVSPEFIRDFAHRVFSKRPAIYLNGGCDPELVEGAFRQALSGE